MGFDVTFHPVGAAELDWGGQYQWRRDGETHMINPETVAKLFDLIQAGFGFGAIAEHFNKNKVPTFGRSPYWSNSTLHSIALDC